MLEEWVTNDERPLVVVLTGAGISAESGIPTFRDADGLWEGHDVMQVATPEAFQRDPELVLRFYNLRREAAAKVAPNPGHKALVELEDDFNVVVITQNVDDLHERAGSCKVLHLHGKLREVRSSADATLVYDIGDKAVRLGDKCDKGSQLRPNVVWFGEAVPNYPIAEEITRYADYLMVVGTSMVVYPAAGLVHYAPGGTPVYIVNPETPPLGQNANFTPIEENASTGVPKAVELIRRAHAEKQA